MNLTHFTARSLVAEMGARRIGAEQVMRATLDRIAAHNGALNAIVALRDSETLLAEARACDAGPVRGPLHGLPIAIKDLANVAGMVTSMGSPLFADNVAERDDIMVARLRAAGAIVIGKTNVPEFGLGSHTFNPVYGSTANPYDPARTCGGSSGGAAVALATGMLTVADGSDMMGSLRNPAGWNNVYGFRPTWGLVPAQPDDDAYLHRMATLGPMARDPGDIALLLDVMAGPDPQQPLSLPRTPVGCPEPAPMGGVRIGWLGDWGGAMPLEPGIGDLCRVALAEFERLGARVDSIAAPFDAEAMFQAWTVLRAWQVGASLGKVPDESRLKDSAQWELARSRALTGAQIQAASEARTAWFRASVDLFACYDALVLPTAQVWPFARDLPYPTEISGTKMDTYHRWMQVTVPVSLIGLPCLAMPAGFGSAGLPMGLQLFGPTGSDARLLGMGLAYHRVTNWPAQRPAD